MNTFIKPSKNSSLLNYRIIYFQNIYNGNSSCEFKMSSRRGETKRSRSQKHQNKTAWNAYNKFKTDPKSKVASSVTVTNCCFKCTEVIEWKIR